MFVAVNMQHILMRDMSAQFVFSPKVMWMLLYPTNIYLIGSLFFSKMGNSVSDITAGKFLSIFAKLRKAAICFVMCHLSAWDNSALSRRILIKFGIWVFFENMSIKFKF